MLFFLGPPFAHVFRWNLLVCCRGGGVFAICHTWGPMGDTLIYRGTPAREDKGALVRLLNDSLCRLDVVHVFQLGRNALSVMSSSLRIFSYSAVGLFTVYIASRHGYHSFPRPLRRLSRADKCTTEAPQPAGRCAVDTYQANEHRLYLVFRLP